MSILGAIFVTIIIIYIRMWFIDSVFVDKKIKLSLSIRFFFVGILLVGRLFAYSYVLQYLWLSEYYFQNNIGIKSILIFIFYNIIFLLFISLIYGNINKRQIFRFIILWILLFGWIGIWWYNLWLAVILLYYFMSAYAEEIMKFGVSWNIFINSGKDKSDFIFFAVLVWLWFSIIENFLYIGTNIFNEQINLIWLSIGRWMIASTLHIASTWLVAYVASIGLDWKKYVRSWIYVLIWMILGFWIHAIYNLSLFYNFKFIWIGLLIFSYFLLNYLVFKSDIVYKKKNIYTQPT